MSKIINFAKFCQNFDEILFPVANYLFHKHVKNHVQIIYILKMTDVRSEYVYFQIYKFIRSEVSTVMPRPCIIPQVHRT
jgi:hypothetical protein